MASRIRNVLLTALFAAVLCAPLGGFALRAVGVWDGTEPQWTSYLDGGFVNRPVPSAGTVLSGEFQAEADAFVSGHYPYRDVILETVAGAQRATISAAAKALGYPVWLTYFGSVFYYSSTYDCVLIRPPVATESSAGECAAAVDAILSFAGRHPDVPVCVYALTTLGESEYGPARGLCADVVDGRYLREHLFGPLEAGCTVVYEPVSSTDELVSQMWRTDHHWQMSLAYTAYAQLLGELLPQEEPTAYEVLDLGIDMYGSYSRSGVCPTAEPDHFYDYWVDLSGLEVTVDGKAEEPEFLDSGYGHLEWAPFNRFFDHYNRHWHGNYGIICIENPAAPVPETLVIVGDSFSSPLERLFAQHYARVVRVDPRFSPITLDEAVELYDASAVAFIQDENSLRSAEELAALQPA